MSSEKNESFAATADDNFVYDSQLCIVNIVKPERSSLSVRGEGAVVSQDFSHAPQAVVAEKGLGFTFLAWQPALDGGDAQKAPPPGPIERLMNLGETAFWERRNLHNANGRNIEKIEALDVMRGDHAISKSFSENSRLRLMSEGVRGEVLDQLTRLMKPGEETLLPLEMRQSLALELLMNLMWPEKSINQIPDSCTLAALEVRVATLHPEKYARLLTDLALDGQFVSTKGTSIDVLMSTIEPTEFERNGDVNAASVLFQVAAANCKVQSLHTEDGAVKHGDFSLIRKPDGTLATVRRANAGEKLILVDEVPREPGEPAVGLGELDQSMIARMIVGDADKFIGVQASNANASSFDEQRMIISSGSDLSRALRDIKEGKIERARFPLLVSVDFAALPEMRMNVARGAYHAMTIVDYLPDTDCVLLNNTHGRSNDFIEPIHPEDKALAQLAGPVLATTVRGVGSATGLKQIPIIGQLVSLTAREFEKGVSIEGRRVPTDDANFGISTKQMFAAMEARNRAPKPRESSDDAAHH